MTEEIGAMSGATDKLYEGQRILERGNCWHCMFYHHAESECRRQPPTRDSTAEVIAKLAGLIYPAARDGKAGDDLYAAHRHAQWPVVEETDFCGEFQRGSALLPETLEEQKLHDPSPEEDE